MLKTILNIEGMTCDHCVSSVTKILENFSGVTEVTVSLAENTATVSYDELKTTPSEMSKAIENDGYTVKNR
ncbi:hypothetical protein MNBD_NITROSPIRAE01-621 [hydrothermal vent metagenome]|uniref:HMA domain-containing protein n=1 Tax=hydrothermal vent metagenome TaxID=652676 RepID=A0A3B1CEX5_9ZZZZ|nr:heavy-metal-associated domain-containing protein [Candidatus Manganitrophaceae bacterium]